MGSKISLLIRRSLHKETVDREKTLEVQRQEWTEACLAMPPEPDCTYANEVIAGVPCLWIYPQARQERQIVIYAHGGGLISGSITTHRPFVSKLALAVGRPMLMVGYRLLPENPYDAPRDDFVSVYQELIRSGRYEAHHLAFAGDSSGAAVAVSALVHLRSVGTPLPRAMISLSGAFDTSLSGESIKTRNDIDPLLSAVVLEDWQTYFKDKVSLVNPVISPLFAELQELPSTLLLVGDHEVWLDDSIRMANRLEEVQVPVNLSIYEDMWHVWPMHFKMPEAIEAKEEIKEFLDACWSCV